VRPVTKCHAVEWLERGRSAATRHGSWVHAVLALAVLSGCGGGNPLGNPDTVSNPPTTDGRHLSFVYFQSCVQPMLATPQPGPSGSNTCAAGGCHDSVTGTGGALRLNGAAEAVDLLQVLETTRSSEMYRNFISAQGVTVIGDATASLLLAKPLVQNVLHGGGLILDSGSLSASRLRFWITRPMPAGQDEFSEAGLALFDISGACRTE
jgi:hypothetical protein